MGLREGVTVGVEPREERRATVDRPHVAQILVYRHDKPRLDRSCLSKVQYSIQKLARGGRDRVVHLAVASLFTVLFPFPSSFWSLIPIVQVPRVTTQRVQQGLRVREGDPLGVKTVRRGGSVGLGLDGRGGHVLARKRVGRGGGREGGGGKAEGGVGGKGEEGTLNDVCQHSRGVF